MAHAEEREEAGTPDILGNIRAGLALGLKHRLGEKLVEAGEEAVVSRMMAGLKVGVCVCVWGGGGGCKIRTSRGVDVRG